MGASKEIFAIMREQEFNELSPEFRNKLLSIEVREANEWQENQDDANYRMLYKAKKKATKDLQEYLFNKRHNLKNN
jgi:hypothetical protein